MKSSDGVEINIHHFRSMIFELIRLLDNGASIPRNTISKILDDGKNVIQYIEYALPHRMDWSIFDKATLDLMLEVICSQHTVREKHAIAKNEGLLFLLNACMSFTDPEMLEEYDKIICNKFYQGDLTEEEMWHLKHMGVRSDEIKYY